MLLKKDQKHRKNKDLPKRDKAVIKRKNEFSIINTFKYSHGWNHSLIKKGDLTFQNSLIKMGCFVAYFLILWGMCMYFRSFTPFLSVFFLFFSKDLVTINQQKCYFCQWITFDKQRHLKRMLLHNEVYHILLLDLTCFFFVRLGCLPKTFNITLRNFPITTITKLKLNGYLKES